MLVLLVYFPCVLVVYSQTSDGSDDLLNVIMTQMKIFIPVIDFKCIAHLQFPVSCCKGRIRFKLLISTS